MKPSSKFAIVKCLIAVSAVKGWELHQLDVNNAFLNGDLDEEVFMKIPQGLYQEEKGMSISDNSLFTMSKGESKMVVLVYVDDLIVARNDTEKCKQFKTYLQGCFQIKDLGPLSYFLGLEVKRTKYGIYLSRHKYAKDIITELGLEDSKHVESPIPQQHGLSADIGEPIEDAWLYKWLLGDFCT
ncbi:UNVERIFIED_CONTAM: Retrovirus-related Pol polyprotein from transposon RE2 [Sesamum latifolium]|uniref:Retrovirus-related Pol polyprotein from transposon RE2 n=1 Tax=Sesamum latifolium TaxID=2727402 RepID=A0AAW2X609_9LAMI